MHYDFDVTIPPNTLEVAPQETEVTLTHGIITRVELDFHPGAAGLAHIQIFHGLHKVWPTNPEGSFHADARVIAWDEYYPLTDSPYSFTIRAWNLDDTYEHEVIVGFALLPESVVVPSDEKLAILKRLQRWFFGAALAAAGAVGLRGT